MVTSAERSLHWAAFSSAFFLSLVSCSGLRVRAILSLQLSLSAASRFCSCARSLETVICGADQILLLERPVEHLAHLIVFVLGAQPPGLVEPGLEPRDLVGDRLQLVEPLQIGDRRLLGVDLALQIVFFAGARRAAQRTQ